MVQILERPKSTKERFLEAFARGGQALPGAFAPVLKERQTQQAATGKELGGLRKWLSGELKAGRRETIGPKAFDLLHDQIEQLVRAGVPKEQAFGQVLAAYESGNLGDDLPSSSQTNALGGVLGIVPSLMSSFLSPMKSPIPQKQESLAPIAQLIKEHPGKAALLAGLGSIEPLASPLTAPPSEAAKEFIQSLGFTYPEHQKESAPSYLRKKILEGVPEELQKGAAPIEFAGSLVNPLMLLRLAGKGLKAGKGAMKLLGGPKAPPKVIYPSEILPAEGQAVRISPEARSLAGRVGKVPETATEMRVARTQPEARIYPRTERILQREEQLERARRSPALVREMEQDALEKAARREGRIPKKDKGRMSRKIRQVEAEKRLPAIRANYHNAASHVRALEDEMVRLPVEQRKELEPILERAKKELKDATFDLKQGIDNLRGLGYKSLAQESKEAAQKKLLGIQDKISSGEEIVLSKKDYNPEWEKKAEALSKKKPIPYEPKDDFYNQVHQQYMDVYNDRLRQIENKINSLRNAKTGSAAQQIGRLKKEKEIIEKMIRSAEGEQAVHRHKFGLREIHNRRRVQELMKDLKKTKGSPKVKQAAQEKLWKNRIKETVENPTSEAAEDLAQKTGAKKEDFQEAKSDFKQAWEEVNRKTPPPPPKPGEPRKFKKAPPAGTDLKKELLRTLRNLKKKRYFHTLFRTPVGREILYALATSTANDVFNLKINPYLTPLAGRRIKMAPIRAAVQQVYRWVGPKKTIFKSQYKKALQSRDPEKAFKMKKEHPSWAKEAKEELYS